MALKVIWNPFTDGLQFIDTDGGAAGAELLDGSNQPATGNKNISKVDPESRLTDTGNSEYTRVTKSDTGNLAKRMNRVDYIEGLGIDANCVLMLHMNGANGGTIFTDSSPTTKTASAVGNANTSTAQYKWTSAALLDGVGDEVSVTNHSDFYFNAGAFTIDLWYRNLAGNSMLVSKGYGIVTANGGWALTINGGEIGFAVYDKNINGEFVVTSGAGLGANTWYHIALVRTGTGANQTKIYVNGVLKGTGTITKTTVGNNTAPVRIGRGYANSDFNGYIDECRFSNIARWTADFDLSTAEYETDYSTITEEVDVWKSEDSITAREHGIQTFGHTGGRSRLNGKVVQVVCDGVIYTFNPATGTFIL